MEITQPCVTGIFPPVAPPGSIPDVTLDGLIAWLESLPDDLDIDPASSANHGVLAEYVHQQGFRNVLVLQRRVVWQKPIPANGNKKYVSYVEMGDAMYSYLIAIDRLYPYPTPCTVKQARDAAQTTQILVDAFNDVDELSILFPPA